ncbi:MAG: TIGR02147 family protein [Proteobacteria bacterium]|nr:MAG: TIGR02147 family protein [Pseudomonadota bacterium]
MQKAKVDLNSEFRERLQAEFARRIRANERYSMRSFANHLGIDSSTLSQIISGKRNLSEIKMSSVCTKLGIETPTDRSQGSEVSTLSLDTFAVISDWYHFAILDLTLLKTFKPEPLWIARKLGIKEFEAIGAIERMKRLGLLVEEAGNLKKGQAFYTNYSEGITSAALKEYQRQILKKALFAIDNCPSDRKDITSMTIAANSKKLMQAKEKIKNFRRELCAFLEAGEKDSVLHLAVQLYPVTDLEN